MRITTKTRYATRALLELALLEGEGTLSLQQIASRQEIPPKYLESLFNALRNAGLVASIRGPQGGYRLARPAEQISLRDVYDIFEGQEAFVTCLDRPEVCRRSVDCVAREAWCEFFEKSMQVLEGITLADLARRARERIAAEALDYVI